MFTGREPYKTELKVAFNAPPEMAKWFNITFGYTIGITSAILITGLIPAIAVIATGTVAGQVQKDRIYKECISKKGYSPMGIVPKSISEGCRN